MNLLNTITVTDIKNVITVYSEKGRHDKMLNRDCYGLTFCKSGEITYIHNGKKYISDTSHALILPKGESYEILRNKTGFFPVINFYCSQNICNTIISIPINDIELYLKNYEKICSLYYLKDCRLKMISILYDILHNLLSPTNQGVLSHIIKYIKDNYMSPSLTNTDIASHCHISEVYLRKLFMKQYKTTPKQYIIELRLKKASQLLTSSNLKIFEIAEKCGFSNPYHFCRTFKSNFGITPTEYIIKNRSFII